MQQSAPNNAPAVGDSAAAVSEARQQARHALETESHASVPGTVSSAAVVAMRVVVGVLLFWVIVSAAAPNGTTGRLMIPAGVGLALCAALAEALMVRSRLHSLERELQRERDEIRNNRDHEREEVRLLYAAKGFAEPLLTQVVDTLCADDDRLLKVMMHEELGLATEQLHHPVTVGLVTAIVSLVAAIVVALSACVLSTTTQVWATPATAAACIVMLAWVRSRLAGHDFIDAVTSWLITATVTAGTGYFLIRLVM